MTREEFEQYAIKNNLVVWSKEQSESAIKALEELPKRRKEAKRWKAKAAQIASKQNEWIPVDERLPEDIRPVIVTWKNNDPKSYYQYIVGKHFIGTAHYKNGTWFWYSSITEDMLAEYDRCDTEEFDEAIEVIAWMPLPKPYESQERSGEE